MIPLKAENVNKECISTQKPDYCCLLRMIFAIRVLSWEKKEKRLKKCS